MESAYDPGRIEKRWYETWEEGGFFRPSGRGTPYCIMMPPPNVTGSLHMGHAFQATLADMLIRYHRMMGRDTLWQPGTDHAGIATQIIVDRQLAEEGESRHDLGREEFTRRMWDWQGRSGGRITQQLRRMGSSPDWSRERFTMDEGFSEAVLDAFVRLFDEGLIYRGKRLVNWDPELQTALSDLEVLSEEEPGHLWSLRYPLKGGEGHVVVATTRPETMFGDVAVAVHPDDERYAHLIGSHAVLPLVGRELPIIADDAVEPEFGTGCVKITPAHDFDDYDMGRRHELPLINIWTPDAHLNDEVPEQYRGLDRTEARRRVLADLEEAGLVGEVKEQTIAVPRGDRTGAVIEPYLTDQWFLAVADFIEPSVAAVTRGDIEIIPEGWRRQYVDWMEGLRDWCISRQIWWGHRIPAWYDEEGRVYVGRTEAEARARNGLADDLRLEQDDDVLDTWFSSALWPFVTLGWPDETEELSTYYPTDVMITAFDILYFWVSRMIMMGLKLRDGAVPFRKVFIHGLIRDREGKKMSKSKGNVLDPLDFVDGVSLDELVEKRTSGLMQPWLAPEIEAATRKEFPDGISGYGADALRLTFASLSSWGQDIAFDQTRLEGDRKFCNKLWNASRFVLMNVPEEHDDGPVELGPADHWIVSRLHRTIRTVHDGFERFRFDQVASALYEFVWNEYCDWYLELAKGALNDETTSATRARGTRRTLIETLETVLRLLHPVIPFITEELWQRVAPRANRSGETLMLQDFPVADGDLIDQDVEAEIEWIQAFALEIRRIRGEMAVSPGKAVDVLVAGGSDDDHRRLEEYGSTLRRLITIDTLGHLDGDEEPESAVAVLGGMRLLVPLAGLVDRAAEADRLEREIEKIRAGLSKVDAQLGMQSFVERAPADVVDGARRRRESLSSSLEVLIDQRRRLEE